MPEPRFLAPASTFFPQHGQRFYIDTNIWYKLYGPDPRQTSSASANAYGTLLARIRTNNGIMLTSHTVLSEFINRVARDHYNIWKGSTSIQCDFKGFRKSPDFPPVARDIHANVTSILKFTQVVGEPAYSEHAEFWQQFTSGKIDFNDYMIYQICKENDCILVTDDEDMLFPDLRIVTENKKVLRNA